MSAGGRFGFPQYRRERFYFLRQIRNRRSERLILTGWIVKSVDQRLVGVGRPL